MIRSILYLDEQKLYSLSSQVLEGITEYLLTENQSATEATENQKGPIASGRVLAEAIKSSNTSVERRVLHDHALALFEDKLVKSGKLTDIFDVPGAHDVVPQSFVRVSAPAKFIDPAQLTNLLTIFNSLGEALAYVTNTEAIQVARTALDAIKPGKPNAAQADLLRELKAAVDPAQLAKKGGLSQDPKLLENLSLLLKFAFADQLELQQAIDGILCSSPLRRDCLREAEGLLIRKYSRKTEKSLVVLGVVTQTAFPISDKSAPKGVKPSSMKEAVTNMVDHIAALESTLSAKMEGELIIDPIAVYVSL